MNEHSENLRQDRHEGVCKTLQCDCTALNHTMQRAMHWSQGSWQGVLPYLCTGNERERHSCCKVREGVRGKERRKCWLRILTSGVQVTAGRLFLLPSVCVKFPCVLLLEMHQPALWVCSQTFTLLYVGDGSP